MIRRLETDPTDIHAANSLTRTLVKLTLGVDFRLIETPHFQKALKEDDCDISDAINVLEKGRIIEPAEWDIKYGSYVFRVHGKTIDNDDAVVAEIIIIEKIESEDKENEENLIGLKLITFWKK